MSTTSTTSTGPIHFPPLRLLLTLPRPWAVVPCLFARPTPTAAPVPAAIGAVRTSGFFFLRGVVGLGFAFACVREGRATGCGSRLPTLPNDPAEAAGDRLPDGRCGNVCVG